MTLAKIYIGMGLHWTCVFDNGIGMITTKRGEEPLSYLGYSLKSTCLVNCIEIDIIRKWNINVMKHTVRDRLSEEVGARE